MRRNASCYDVRNAAPFNVEGPCSVANAFEQRAKNGFGSLSLRGNHEIAISHRGKQGIVHVRLVLVAQL